MLALTLLRIFLASLIAWGRHWRLSPMRMAEAVDWVRAAPEFIAMEAEALDMAAASLMPSPRKITDFPESSNFVTISSF